MSYVDKLILNLAIRMFSKTNSKWGCVSLDNFVQVFFAYRGRLYHYLLKDNEKVLYGRSILERH